MTAERGAHRAQEKRVRRMKKIARDEVLMGMINREEFVKLNGRIA
jgi:hypothetical protein